jgi:hypothetical protein
MGGMLSALFGTWSMMVSAAVAQLEERHCEERSDEAIQGSARQAAVRRNWIATPPRGGSR